MKREIILIGLLLAIIMILIGCAGDDDVERDKIPPTKPVLVPHLGDTGDGQVTYNGRTFFLDDSNNGIDAESGHPGFRLMWEPLIYDNDLEKIIYYRYMNDDIENIVKVDSTTADHVNYFDNSISPDFLHENKFSYFIDVFDRAGNSTRSDTVHYRLAEKVYLVSPQNGANLPSLNNVVLDWQYTGNYDFFRVLLFDESNTLLWFKDILIDAPDEGLADDSSATYTGGSLASGNYYWRVDVFKYDFELDDFYNGNQNESGGRTFYYGSESELSEFSIGNKKK